MVDWRKIHIVDSTGSISPLNERQYVGYKIDQDAFLSKRIEYEKNPLDLVILIINNCALCDAYCLSISGDNDRRAGIHPCSYEFRDSCVHNPVPYLVLIETLSQGLCTFIKMTQRSTL